MANRNQIESDELTEEKILGALRHSGFPLEIRLLRIFRDEDFNPQQGFRVHTGDDDCSSAEIDVIAGCEERFPSGNGGVSLRALIEAKNFGDRVAFVGFKWDRPKASQMRSMRIRFSGAPTCLVLPNTPGRGDLEQLMLSGDRPPASAFDALNNAPLCPTWAVVHSTKNRDFLEADKDHNRMRESLAKLVRATTKLEETDASYLLDRPQSSKFVSLRLLLPTLVVATPHLFLYDAATDALEKVPRLILQGWYETPTSAHCRYVDVFCESAVLELVALYRRATTELRDACKDLEQDLCGVVAAQHPETRAR